MIYHLLSDDTNLLHEHKSTIKLFVTVDEELMNINDCYVTNKLSLNVGKIKYSLFHKPSMVHDLPLKLPKLLIIKKQTEHPIRNLSVFF